MNEHVEAEGEGREMQEEEVDSPSTPVTQGILCSSWRCRAMGLSQRCLSAWG